MTKVEQNGDFPGTYDKSGVKWTIKQGLFYKDTLIQGQIIVFGHQTMKKGLRGQEKLKVIPCPRISV